MKLLTAILTGAIMAGAAASPAGAQSQLRTIPSVRPAANVPAATDADAYRSFLDNNPKIARRLKRHPERLYDPRFRDEHPELAQFVKDHPKTWDRIKARREAYIKGGRYRKFIAEHPDIARKLRENPRFLRDANFLREHPALRDYLKNNPEARRDIRKRYLRKRPGLKKYVKEHPGVRRRYKRRLGNDGGAGTASRPLRRPAAQAPVQR